MTMAGRFAGPPGVPGPSSKVMPVRKRYMDSCWSSRRQSGSPRRAACVPFLPALAAGASATVPLRRLRRHRLRLPGVAGVLIVAAVALVAVTVIELRRGGPALASTPGGRGWVDWRSGWARCCSRRCSAGAGYPAWPGLVGGLLCAALAAAGARDFFHGWPTGGRQARSALVVYLEGLALALGLLATAGRRRWPWWALSALAVVTLRGRRRRRQVRGAARLR